MFQLRIETFTSIWAETKFLTTKLQTKMKKFYGILLLIALMAFKTNVQAQTCAGVTAGAVLLGPTPGSNGLSTTTNDYLVKVTLSQTYNQDVTVSGYFYAAAGGLNYDNPFSVIVGAGSLSA